MINCIIDARPQKPASENFCCKTRKMFCAMDLVSIPEVPGFLN